MGPIEKLCALYQHTLVICDLWFHFVIYKFEKNKIQRDEEDINGKCVVVTGGSGGIGKSRAKEFARRGAIVVIGDKNVESGKNTVEEIRRDTGNMNVTILKLDLSDMDSVEEFGKRVSADHPHIKILLNNAGIGASEDENIKTKDGFNIHVAVNYMGHFLLTNILMDNLRAETNARVVSMSSSYLQTSQFNVDDLNMDKIKFGFTNCVPYSNTKFMLALLTKELGKRNGIKAYALCPGIVNTQIFDNAPILVKLAMRLSMICFSTSPDETASDFVMHCALEKSIANESGKTFRFRKHFHNANKILDNYSERQLYETSAKLVKLQERLARMNKIIPE